MSVELRLGDAEALDATDCRYDLIVARCLIWSLPCTSLHRQPHERAMAYAGSNRYSLTTLLVADTIRELGSRRLEFTRRGHVDVVLLKRTPLGKDRVHLRLRISRVFKVGIHKHLLNLRAGQKINEFDGIGTIFGMCGDASGGY